MIVPRISPGLEFQQHVFTAFEDSLKTHETGALEINIITSGFTNWALAK